ncbi:pfkB family carbohydrate kinase [Rhizobium sp. 9140]|nr:pfkB family carbohydrate kinase [Rhizobium sp. 9140]
MIKIAAMGDNVVDCYISKRQMFPGGNCLNLSIFIRRFGGQSAYIGAIGKDEAGAVIKAALQTEGVDLARLRVLDGPTAYCIIGHRDADRIFVRADLGVSMFAPDPADIAWLSTFSAVHIGQSSGLDAHVPQAAGQTRLSYDFSTRRDADHRKAIAPFCFLASVSAGDLDRAEALAIAQELRGTQDLGGAGKVRGPGRCGDQERRGCWSRGAAPVRCFWGLQVSSRSRRRRPNWSIRSGRAIPLLPGHSTGLWPEKRRTSC